jgi:glycosidase
MRASSIVALFLFVLASCESRPTDSATHVGDWRDRVIYQIIVDRFENGDPENDAADGVEPVPGDLSRAQGGDWRGILQRLDYLERLGVNAIWISPIVANVPRMEGEDGYHGYWASDFTTLNPRFGSFEDLKTLVDAAHARDIAVIVDIVTNHTGRVFAYDLNEDGVIDANENEPAYRMTGYDVSLLWSMPRPRLFVPDSDGSETFALDAAHFHRRGVGNLGDYEERRYGDFPTGLRDLDTARADIVMGMIETYSYWALALDIDGFRIDAVPHIEVPFWQRFCDGVRRRLAAHGKHRFLMVGEVFEHEASEIARHTVEGALDSSFDFPMKFGFINDVILGGAPPERALTVLERNRSLFRETPQPFGAGLSPWQARVAIADNHDVPRIGGEISDPFAVDQALVAIFTIDAIPGIYYGTEQEFRGRNHHEAREPMWESGFRENVPAFELIQRLSRLRRESMALRRGSLEVRYASEVGGAELERPSADAGMIVWERVHSSSIGEERVFVAMNTHPTRISRARVATSFAPGTRLIDRLSEETSILVTREGALELELAPRSSMILFAE